MIHAFLLAGAIAADDWARAPVNNPVFATINSEACNPKEPHQTIAYPPQLFGTEISGVVMLLLFLNPCGEVRHVIISESSGVPVLDDAAVENAMKWVISPERANLKKGHGGVIRIPVHFEG